MDKIKGHGRVKFLLNDGMIETLLGVLHIPNMERNLISIRKMSAVGVHTIFGKGKCKMFRGEMVLMRGVQCETLHNVLGSTITDRCNRSIVPEGENKVIDVPRENIILWHWRLEHIGEKGLQALQGKGMVEGMPNWKLEFDCCEHCLYGKQNRVKFPSSIVSREKGILDLIHSDVFGPIPIPSLEGSLYYFSFINNFSRNMWLYLLKNKFEVFDKFKFLKALMENQIGKK